MGILSLIFWSLILIVTVKYVTLIMRADNRGEGGILALMALAQRVSTGKRARNVLGLVGITGAFGVSSVGRDLRRSLCLARSSWWTVHFSRQTA